MLISSQEMGQWTVKPQRAEAEQLQSLIYFLILYHSFIHKLLFCARPVLSFKGTEMNQIYSLLPRNSDSSEGHVHPEISTLASKSPCTAVHVVHCKSPGGTFHIDCNVNRFVHWQLINVLGFSGGNLYSICWRTKRPPRGSGRAS